MVFDAVPRERAPKPPHTGTTEQSQQPLVSVVIVSYNQARFLPDAIASVLAQTYENVEIIVVDDGSIDDAAAIAKSFTGVRYMRQENCGLSAARNAGLQASQGKYTVFLDGDDRLLPQAVEAGIECFREYPDSGFVFGGYRHFFGEGSRPATQRDAVVTGDYYWDLLHGNFIGMHATVMYSRDVLESLGGFNSKLRAAEDYELYLRIARRWEVVKHGSVIAEYRRHDANMSADRIFMLRSVRRVLDMERAHVPDRRHLRALRSGINFYRHYYGTDLIHEWNKQRNLTRFLAVMRWYPSGMLRRVVKHFQNRLASSRKVHFGSLRRVTPFSREFGFDRGKPVDRVYIESFLNSFAADIRGRVLEIGDDYYSRTYGGSRITKQDVLHITPGHPAATIIADLTDAPHIPSESFDCTVITQTLHLMYDVKAALATLHRILKPGGVLLATVPGITQMCRDAAYPEADSWRFTTSSAERLFTEWFAETEVRTQSYGNVLTATAFLYGLAAHELKAAEVDYLDADYPVIIGIRARKGGASQ